MRSSLALLHAVFQREACELFEASANLRNLGLINESDCIRVSVVLHFNFVLNFSFI